MRINTILLLLMIVVCTYARSFSDIDIPDPPQIKRDNAEKNNNVKEIRLKNKKSEIRSSKEEREVTTKPSTSPKPTTSPKPPTTPAITSSTLDPWDEFCKEACAEGLAGPECDCPEHPIGRRSVGNRRHRRSTYIDTSKTDETEPLKHQYTSKAKPTMNLKVKRLLMKYCNIVCDYGIENDICKCNGPPNKPGFIDKDPSYNINGSAVVQGNSTSVPSAEGTTKDPLDEFCESACSEGQGSLACNCHDHIVGRRRRSLSRSFGQYQDITHMENALPRITLNKDSVQQQDLSVNFPFRTLPEKIRVHKDKFARVQLYKVSRHNQDLGVDFPYRKMTEKKQK